MEAVPAFIPEDVKCVAEYRLITACVRKPKQLV
jgi:hypothetical protein